ncbi:MAG: DNA polymerase IV, partial [Chrysiogenales bacterium]
LSLSVARSLDKGGYRGRTITLKIRYDDFTTVSRSATLDEPCVDAEMIFMQSGNLIRKTEAGSRKVRLIGISLSNFKDDDRQGVDRQLLLPFDV